MNNVLKGKRILVSAIFFSLVGSLLQSCKKEDSAVGVNLQGDLLNASVIDTFNIVTYSEREDSLRTDELSNCILGSYVDPTFGKTTSTIYTQLGLASPGVSVNMSTTTVDSVQLHMRYSGYYGELDAQTFTVQRLNQRFYKDSSQYSNTSLTTDGMELILPGYETVTPNTTDNTIIGTDTISPVLVLRLNPATVGTDILNGVAGGNLANETAFSNFFYGLRIGVNNSSQPVNSGGVLYFNMLDAETKMIIYYTESGVQKELSFPVGSNQGRFSHFDHDYTGTPVEAELADHNLGQKFFYTQSMAGVHSMINIPGIEGLKNLGHIIINKAELYLPVEYFITSPYQPAGPNFIVHKTSSGTYAVLYDQLFDYSVYGGVYDNSRKAVVFNIGLHLQRILRGQEDNLGFKIVNGATSVSCSRNIYSGKLSPNREKPYLKVYYTKY